MESVSTLDKFESAILGLLEFTPPEVYKRNTYIEGKSRYVNPTNMIGDTSAQKFEITLDYWSHVDIKPMAFESPWLFAEYPGAPAYISTTADYWMKSFPELVGDSFQHIVLTPEINDAKETLARFVGLKRIKKIPAPYYTMQKKQISAYEYHYYIVYLDGTTYSDSALCAWNERINRQEPVFCRGYAPLRTAGLSKSNASHPDPLGLVGGIADSIYGMWNVDISYEKTIRLAPSPDGVAELATLRDMPRTDTSRLRPILHWVKAHKRTRKSLGPSIDVKKHLRGITEFNIDEFHFKITEPVK